MLRSYIKTYILFCVENLALLLPYTLDAPPYM